jgi:hypothetical protein
LKLTVACRLAAQPPAQWRRRILDAHTLLAVIQLPNFTFQPQSGVCTHVIVIQKGSPQGDAPTFFHRMGDAGLVYEKEVVKSKAESSNADAIALAVQLFKEPAGLTNADAQRSAVVNVDCTDWTTGQNLPWQRLDEGMLLVVAHRLVRSWAANRVTHVSDLIKQRARIDGGALEVKDFSSVTEYADAVTFRERQTPGTIGAAYLAPKGATHAITIKNLAPGSDLLVTGAMIDNGMSEKSYDLRRHFLLVRSCCDCMYTLLHQTASDWRLCLAETAVPHRHVHGHTWPGVRADGGVHRVERVHCARAAAG